jgi:membrane protease YdiL (CAAX protease family)
VPPWAQVVAVVGLFLATLFLAHAEYRAKGTSFGYSGPAFNMLICPIYEELIFRGWILGRLARWRSPAIAIAVSSLLFGILHLRLVYWLDTRALLGVVAYTGLVLGPLLGWVALRCKSVWPAVILHYVNNLLYFVRL